MKATGQEETASTVDVTAFMASTPTNTTGGLTRSLNTPMDRLPQSNVSFPLVPVNSDTTPGDVPLLPQDVTPGMLLPVQ